ncbi:MAG: hypothetical protein K940chlam9_02098, partial [Chlamydiae bacterium]|nr:hypothetical protein [Chlamydiota bacterium]
PGAMELGRLLGYSQVATGLALYKYPTLGLALTMMTKVEAQVVGSEFQVNTYTTSDQWDSSAAPLNDGGFVVTWESDGQDGDVYGVYGQRYDSSGVKSGVEFQVNTYTTSDQQDPSVAPLNDGGFVVTWESSGQDGNAYGIYGQRYDSSGVKSGVEFQVNTYTTSGQRDPSVAPLNDGGFVVTWESLGQDGDSWGVYGQRYDSSGVKSGVEFQVNTYTTSDQRDPSVAPLNDGGFVVTWHSNGQDGDSSYGVYGQKYDSSGVKSGLEFQVNTYTTSLQDSSSAAPLNDGGFVVTWHSNGQDGDLDGVYGQRYDSNGNPIELILSNATNTTSTLLSTPSSVPTGTQ